MSVSSADDKKSLILHLVEKLEALPHRDETALDALRGQGEMVLRNVYGGGHRNIVRFIGIPFKLGYLVTKAGAQDRAWTEGVDRMRNFLETLILEFDTFPQAQEPQDELDKPKDVSFDRVFVAHGHDDVMLTAVRAFLMTLDIEPVVLKGLPHSGRTVIEKFEDYADVPAAIILLTPDDEAYPRTENPEDAVLQPRQNPVLELGYFMGKLGRSKLIVVHKREDGFRFPSDINGVGYVPFVDDETWKKGIATELHAIGFDIDPSNFFRA